EDPLGQTVRVGTQGLGTVVLTIIGVLEPTGLRTGPEGGSMMQRDLDMDLYFPLTLAHDAFGDNVTHRQAGTFERKQIELSEIWLKADSIEDVERLAGMAENLIGFQHKNGPHDLTNSPRLDAEVKAPIQLLRAA